jgi:2-dehydro-3-deoxy-D-arabinonate dehydratase
MRIMQFKTSEGLRVAVSRDNGSPPVDITEGLSRHGLVGLNAAIGHARTANVSLMSFITAMADASVLIAAVDLSVGAYNGSGADYESLPVQPPEVWGAGVTYRRSREAREAESVAENDFYSRVYAAERPEIFFKDSSCRRTVGPNSDIGIRGDSASSIPEPELGLVLDSSGRVVGFTLGNDVTARDIESENPLYLPQAKIFSKSCAIGPCVLLCDTDPDLEPSFSIEMSIHSPQGELRYQDSTSTRELTRRFADLVGYLTRDNPVPDGTVLLTGTGLVPPPDFTLRHGDIITITSERIGSLRNTAADLAMTSRESQMASVPSSTGMQDLP